MILTLFACTRPDPLGGSVVLGHWSGNTHPIVVDRRLAGLPARLDLDASTWQATVTVDGEPVAVGVGGNAPLRVLLPAGLSAGAHTLGVTLVGAAADTVLPGRTVADVDAWTFREPSAQPVFSGRATLRFGAAAEDVDPSVWLEDGRLHAALDGVAGHHVGFTVVLDGRVLQDLGGADADASGRAAVDAPWTGPGWRDALPELVATRDDGARWAVRFGARDVDRAGDRIAVDGDDAWKAAVRVDLAAQGGDLRPRLYADALAAAARGAAAFEWHGGLWSEEGMRVADELGIGVIVTPRCDGRRRREGVPKPDAARAAFVDAENRRMALAFARHPSAWAWTLEWDDDRGHGAADPAMRATDLAFFDADEVGSAVPGRDLHRFPWIGEIPGVGVDRPAEDTLAVIALHGGAGLVLPTLPHPLGDAAVAGEAAATAAKGAHAWTLPAGRKGPSTVDVHGDPGTVAWVELPDRPAVGVAVGADGYGSVDVDYAGPARVRMGDAERDVTLVAGTWEADGWHAAHTAAR